MSSLCFMHNFALRTWNLPRSFLLTSGLGSQRSGVISIDQEPYSVNSILAKYPMHIGTRNYCAVLLHLFQFDPLEYVFSLVSSSYYLVLLSQQEHDHLINSQLSTNIY